MLANFMSLKAVICHDLKSKKILEQTVSHTAKKVNNLKNVHKS